jgi:RimJ/RimL family protein N-acetyltransferase
VPEADAPALFQALNRDQVWRHLAGRPRTSEAHMATLNSQLAEGCFIWIVRLAAEQAGLAAGSVVGTTSYLEIGVNDARLEIGGTAYRPEVWATRVNPEAKLLLLRFAFEQLGAGRMQLETDVRNQRSQRAIARLGARYEGTLRRYQRRDDGSVRDTVLFSIIAEEWPAVREGLPARLS